MSFVSVCSSVPIQVSRYTTAASARTCVADKCSGSWDWFDWSGTCSSIDASLPLHGTRLTRLARAPGIGRRPLPYVCLQHLSGWAAACLPLLTLSLWVFAFNTFGSTSYLEVFLGQSYGSLILGRYACPHLCKRYIHTRVKLAYISPKSLHHDFDTSLDYGLWQLCSLLYHLS